MDGELLWVVWDLKLVLKKCFSGDQETIWVKVGSVTDQGYKVESIEKSGNIFKAILSGVKNPQKIISVKTHS